MNDNVCDALRDAIYNAIIEEVDGEDSQILSASGETESITVSFTDVGLAVRIGGSLYGIIIERV